MLDTFRLDQAQVNCWKKFTLLLIPFIPILKFTFVQKPVTRYTYNTEIIAITITGSYCLFHF